MDVQEIARLIQAVGRADLELVAETRGALLLELADEWKVDAPLTGLRESTLKQYRISLGLMARTGIRAVSDVTPHAVRAFMRGRLALGRCPETVNRNLAALSSLFTWLHAEGRVPLLQVLELRELFLDRPARPAPEFLRPDRYLKIREIARAIDPLGRFELLVAFGVEAGLRFHEAQQLEREDLMLEREEPFVRVWLTRGRRNKTSRQRTSPIRTAFAQELLARELPAGPIFPARVRAGEDLLSPYLHRGTFRTWREASLERAGAWNWHLLRHTFASWHVQAGRDLALVASWLGCGLEVARRHYAAYIPGGSKLCEIAFVDVPTFLEIPTRVPA